MSKNIGGVISWLKGWFYDKEEVDNIGVEYIVGTHGSATTNAWTGTSTKLTSLKKGQVIYYKMTSEGTSSGNTLNLTLAGGTTSGAKTIYYQGSTTKLTTQFPINSVLCLVYDGSYWRVTGTKESYPASNVPLLSSLNGSVGVSNNYAREDHRHPNVVNHGYEYPLNTNLNSSIYRVGGWWFFDEVFTRDMLTTINNTPWGTLGNLTPPTCFFLEVQYGVNDIVSHSNDESNKSYYVQKIHTDTNEVWSRVCVVDNESGVGTYSQWKQVNTNNVYYGTCSTTASTQIKEVTAPNFVLSEGVVLNVKFTNQQTYNASNTNPVQLKINNSNSLIDIVYVGDSKATRYHWYAGELVQFVYDGVNFIMVNEGVATTTYYGVTKLSSSYTSTSTSLSATPKAVNDVYNLLTSHEHDEDIEDISLTTIKEYNNSNLLVNSKEFELESEYGTLTGEYYKNYAIREFHHDSSGDYTDMIMDYMEGGEFKRGDKFVLSFWAYSSDDLYNPLVMMTSLSTGVGVKMIDYSSNITPNNSNYTNDMRSQLSLSRDWQKYSFMFQFNPDSSSGNLDVRKILKFRVRDSNKSLFVAGLMLEKVKYDISMDFRHTTSTFDRPKLNFTTSMYVGINITVKDEYGNLMTGVPFDLMLNTRYDIPGKFVDITDNFETITDRSMNDNLTSVTSDSDGEVWVYYQPLESGIVTFYTSLDPSQRFTIHVN